jgi:hypothetical protein
MKIENQPPLPEEIEIVDQKQVKKTHQLIATITPHRGHKLWEVNVLTREVKEAEYEVEAVDFAKASKGEMAKRKKVIQKPGFVYLSALNEKNVWKKLRKQFQKSVGQK